MGYKYDKDALSELFETIQDQHSKWNNDELDVLKSRINGFLGSTNISGVAAENIKNYFGYVHLTLIENLMTLINLHYSGFAIYSSNYCNIESGDHAIIAEDELASCKSKLNETKDIANDIDNDLRSALSSVSNIISISPKSVLDVENAHNEGITYLGKIDSDIITHENWHSFNDFNNTDVLLESISNFINLYKAQTRKPITDFNLDEFLKSDTYIELVSLGQFLGNYLDQNSELINTAINNNNQYVAKLQDEERKKREEEANFWLGVIAIGCIVAGAIISICVPGAGTILGAAIVGAAFGAIQGAANEVAKQYVEKGYVSDPWAVAGSAVVGGIAGAATGAVGKLGAGAAVVKPLTASKSSVIRQAASDLGESVIDDAINRGVETYVTTELEKAGELAGSVVTGRSPDVDVISKNSNYEAIREMLNTDKIVEDSITGGIKSSILKVSARDLNLDEIEKNNPVEAAAIREGRENLDNLTGAGVDVVDKLVTGDYKLDNEGDNSSSFGSGGGGAR